jgi:hypothetical protein
MDCEDEGVAGLVNDGLRTERLSGPGWLRPTGVYRYHHLFGELLSHELKAGRAREHRNTSPSGLRVAWRVGFGVECDPSRPATGGDRRVGLASPCNPRRKRESNGTPQKHLGRGSAETKTETTVVGRAIETRQVAACFPQSGQRRMRDSNPRGR